MRRFFDVDDRTHSPVAVKAPAENRPKSLLRFARLDPRRAQQDSVRALVEEAYDRAGEPDCCDPRDLSEGLGITPCPARVRLPCIRDGVLYYPETATIPIRGAGIYYELALMLSPRNVIQVMDELILPTRTAKRLTLPELERVQPNAPYQRVLSIFMRHGHHSGQWPALR